MTIEAEERPRLARILPFLTLTVFLDLVGYGIILPLLPSYIGELGGSPQVVGILFASFAAAQLVAMPVLGRTSDRHGRRRVIAISLAANAVAMILFSLAIRHHALWLLFASRILAGVTSGNIGACQAAIADISEGAERVRAMGKVGAGIGLGVMLGPWIGGRASTLGDAAPPLFAAAMAFVALVGVLVFLPETNTRALVTARPHLSLKALGSNPKIAIVMTLYFFMFLYMTTLQTALALLVAERFGWTKERVGDLFGLFGLVTLVMQFGVVGPISRRMTSPSVLSGAGVLAAIGLAAIALASSSTVLVGGLVVLAMAVGLSHPQLASLASQYAGPGQQGTVLGFAQSSGALSRTIGPILWGSLYHHLGPSAAFLGGTSAAVVVAVVASIARKAPRTVEP
ncbi:MAG: MFS transporter [Labilithrix sp.]|nr:MFS transporter [Labilithrix sp.]MCW5813159.1 MFS transporter [Labilithrix sp.]